MRRLVQQLRQWRPAVVGLLALTVVTGLLYTAVVTGIGQLAFPGRANGSLVTVTLADGTTRTYGSALIGQEFSAPQYLIGRPQGATNWSPTSPEQARLVAQRVAWWHAFDPTNTAPIPMDLVTASGSGVDPRITPAAAEYQVARIAAARGLTPEAVRAVIARYTTGRFLGLLGEPTVNVLLVNLALDGRL